VVTDNGTCFAEFESFLKANGIKHLTSAPYHPASNGLAESVVQIVKKGLRKTSLGSFSSQTTLMFYRLTPQSMTGVSPAELLLGKQPRSRLDLLKPHTAERV
jgi:transposase InsO family protein